MIAGAYQFNLWASFLLLHLVDYLGNNSLEKPLSVPRLPSKDQLTNRTILTTEYSLRKTRDHSVK